MTIKVEGLADHSEAAKILDLEDGVYVSNNIRSIQEMGARGMLVYTYDNQSFYLHRQEFDHMKIA